MKIRFLVLAFVALLMLRLNAQNVSNPGFEQWNSATPVNWTTSISGTLNVNIPVLGNVPVPLSLNFGTQTTDAHSGSYALKIKANGLDLSSFGYPSLTMPGIAQLGTAGAFSVSMETIQQLAGIDWSNPSFEDFENINLEELMSLTNVLSRGDAFAQAPSAMKVWAKYLPPAGVTDTMSIVVAAYSEGVLSSILSGVLPGNFGYYTSSERMEDYTELTIPLTFDPEHVECDSLMIVFISSSLLHANANTELYIDDISFEFNYADILSADQVKLSVYPNPASDYFIISPENKSNDFDIELFDMTGKCMKSLKNRSGDVQVDVSDLSDGIYFVKIMQNGALSVRKIVVE